MLEAESIVDRRRPGTFVEQAHDRIAPRLGTRHVLRLRLFRPSRQHVRAQLDELRQLVGVAVEQTGLRDRESIRALGVRAHPEQSRDLA